MVATWAVQNEIAGSSPVSSNFVQKSQRLGLFPIQPSQNPVIMGPTLGNQLLPNKNTKLTKVNFKIIYRGGF